MIEEEIFIGLGSNIGDARSMFDQACEGLRTHCDILKQSSLYITKPYGYADQPDFTNGALKVSSELSPSDLLLHMKAVEAEVGKIVIRENGPRCIDLDLLFYGEKVLDSKNLIVPHPQSHLRDFVLLPMRELAPDFVHPIQKKSMSLLISQIDQKYHTGKVLVW